MTYSPAHDRMDARARQHSEVLCWSSCKICSPLLRTGVRLENGHFRVRDFGTLFVILLSSRATFCVTFDIAWRDDSAIWLLRNLHASRVVLVDFVIFRSEAPNEMRFHRHGATAFTTTSSSSCQRDAERCAACTASFQVIVARCSRVVRRPRGASCLIVAPALVT